VGEQCHNRVEPRRGDRPPDLQEQEKRSRCAGSDEAAGRAGERTVGLEQIAAGKQPVHVVEQVVRFGAKLESEPFRDRSVFHEREVKVHQAGTDDRVAPRISIGARGGQHKHGRIEIPLRRAVD
jgi:hypothetical protein